VASIIATVGVGAWVVVDNSVGQVSLFAEQLAGGSGAYYLTPWCRAPAYLIGLLLGGLMHENHTRDQVSAMQLCRVASARRERGWTP
jgi:hypothetical protein